MSSIREIEKARRSILKQMQSIRSMKKGSVTEQFLKVKHKGEKDPVLRGPYYAYTRKEGKKTVGYRLNTKGEQEAAKADVAAHKRFVGLCREYVELTERLGELERRQQDGASEKKRRGSPSSKMKK